MNARGLRSAKPKRRTKRADLPRRPSSIRNGACRPKRSAAPRNRHKCKPNGQKCKRTRQTWQPNRQPPSQPRWRHARRPRPTPPRQPPCLSRRPPEPMPSVYGKLLNTILETRESARGLIVNINDVLFDFNKYTLKPGAREKLAKVAGILLAYP